MKKVFFILFCTFFAYHAYGQAPVIQWQKSLGGNDYDFAWSIRHTSDGGYIVAGESYSNNGDVTGNHGIAGTNDYWVVKLSSSGSIQWQKTLGGSGWDFANSIQQTSDGGYIVAGGSSSSDGDVTANHGGTDYWVVKLNDTGAIQWQKSFGGTGKDVANSIIQTADGGYIVAGNSTSNDGDVSGHHGISANDDYWIIKLNDTGSIQWQKSLGGSWDDAAYSIQQTSDSGYIVAGVSSSFDGDISGYHGNSDYWIVKLSSSGSIQWQKALGGSDNDTAKSIQQTFDGGYIISGWSRSNNGDVTGNHGDLDYWVVKLFPSGSIQWQKSLGGSYMDLAFSIQQISDSGYIVTGYSLSNDGNVSGNHGSGDCWIVKLSASGSIQWQKCLGGSLFEAGCSIQQTSDGGYIIAGNSNSNDGDVSGNHGYRDYWIVKLVAESSVNPIPNTPSISIIPNPTTGNISIKGAGLVNIKAFNTMGQLIKEATHTDNISLSEFPAGMYFIKLFNEQGEMVYVDKVIKQ